MCEDLNWDIFGQAYRIVKTQLKVVNLKVDLQTETKLIIFRKLILWKKHSWTALVKTEEIEESISAISVGEVLKARSKVRSRSYLKETQNILRNYSIAIYKSNFLGVWETVTLAHIDKPKKEHVLFYWYCIRRWIQAQYNLLSNTMEKIFDSIINKRLILEIKRKEGLMTIHSTSAIPREM